ncbi:Mpv17-like protein 2 [Takifugu flavidus]|uniref:Mpv17-like protein 2 n=1 Tax=Takifugu flavidus TaxID=433684 RepID=A0A5C6MS44_9TELE|nr:Mpv17-like protein 2 [Takifugu flavidus]
MTARALQASKELLARLPSWRLLFQGRCLVVTNTLGGGVLMAVGDTAQQTREMHMEVGRVRDWKRTGSMFMVGCSMGLIEHYWYCWLDRLCIGRTMTTVLKKVVIDQLICAPGIGLWYFIGMALTEGRSVKDGCVEFKEKFVEYTTASTPRLSGAEADLGLLPYYPLPLRSWLFARCVFVCCTVDTVLCKQPTINFYYLSPKFCVMYINVVSLGWNTYLSYLKHRGNNPPHHLAGQQS